MSPMLILGLVLLSALAVHELAPRIGLPRVTLLMLLGVAFGPVGIDLVPGGQWFETTTELALTMIGLLLGSEFQRDKLRGSGGYDLAVSVGLSLGTAIVVALGLRWVFGLDWTLAILLGGIAPATDPASTIAVVDESNAQGPIARTIRRVVALDDVWGLMAFAIALTIASALQGQGDSLESLEHAIRELGGSVLVGMALGLLASPVSGRIRPGKPTLLEALGLIAVCAGLSEMLELSPLLASLSMGIVLTNLATHHEITFRQVEDIEWPVLVLFFVFAGASLEIDTLRESSGLVAAYVLTRFVGRYLGTLPVNAAYGRLDATHSLWLPTALMPQAGVALGLALSTTHRFPDLATRLVPVVIASTLVFELAGPPLTRIALLRAGAVPETSS